MEDNKEQVQNINVATNLNTLVSKEVTPKNIILDTEGDTYAFQQISETNIRQEFVYLQLFKKLGLNTPNCKLNKNEDSKLSLVIEKERLNNFSKNEKLNENVYLLEIVNHSMGDRKILFAQNTPDDIYICGSLYQDYRFNENPKDKYIKNIIELNPNVVNKAIDILQLLSPDIVFETVIESGLSDVNSQEIIHNILDSKDKMLNTLLIQNEKSINIETKEKMLSNLLIQNEKNIKNSKEICKKLDSLIIQGEINKKFEYFSNLAEDTSKLLPNNEEIETIKTNTTIPNNLTVKSVEKNISQIETSKYGELLKNLNLLSTYKNFINNEKNKVRSFFIGKKLNNILEKIDSLENKAKSDFFNRIEFNIDNLNIGINKIINPKEAYYNPYYTISDLISPTENQLEKMDNLIETIKSNNFTENISQKENFKKFIDIVSKLKARKHNLLRISLDRSSALISTLSKDYGIKKALIDGFLKSSLKQLEEGNEVFKNSLASHGKPLPELCFSINEAFIGYGETKDAMGNDDGLSTGFIGLYPDVVKNNNILEYVGESGVELHIFNPESSVENSKGIMLPIDDLLILVSEKKLDYWNDFLTKTKDQGGAEKDSKWIKEHLRTYPSKLRIDTYLRFFTSSEKLGFKPKLGTFVDIGKKVIYHTDTIDSVYKWKSVSL